MVADPMWTPALTTHRLVLNANGEPVSLLTLPSRISYIDEARLLHAMAGKHLFILLV